MKNKVTKTDPTWMLTLPLAPAPLQVQGLGQGRSWKAEKNACACGWNRKSVLCHTGRARLQRKEKWKHFSWSSRKLKAGSQLRILVRYPGLWGAGGAACRDQPGEGCTEGRRHGGPASGSPGTWNPTICLLSHPSLCPHALSSPSVPSGGMNTFPDWVGAMGMVIYLDKFTRNKLPQTKKKQREVRQFRMPTICQYKIMT